MRKAFARALQRRRGSDTNATIAEAAAAAVAAAAVEDAAVAFAVASNGGGSSSSSSMQPSLTAVSAAGSGAVSISAMGPAEVLAMIERIAPEELCRCAGALASALLRCLAPSCSVRDRGMTLHASVGWVWKLLAVSHLSITLCWHCVILWTVLDIAVSSVCRFVISTAHCC
jgi:hypothetical protein